MRKIPNVTIEKQEIFESLENIIKSKFINKKLKIMYTDARYLEIRGEDADGVWHIKYIPRE